MLLGVPSSAQKVRASYYADKFEGRKMANGQQFRQDSVTVASLKYPLGTLLSVRCPATGYEILVRVTDRGPWHTRYSLDMSKAAFTDLGLSLHSGWGWVIITPVRENEYQYD